MYEHYKKLLIQRNGNVLTITLNNPPVNQMTYEMHDELSRIFTDINQDAATSVVVLTGSGEVFCGGGNINQMIARLENADWASWTKGLEEAKAIIYGLLRLEKPLIGRINGHAMGMGATLAVFCDVTFMVEDAKIADNHVKMGLCAGDGGALMWPVLLGFNKAKEFLFAGSTFSGAEAQAMGLVNHAVPRDQLDARVDAYVKQLANGAVRAIRATKLAINMMLRAQMENLVEAHIGLEMETVLTQDHREAAFAFREKRAPSFKGQ